MTQLHSVASLDYGDGRTCVCRICECGHHHCPGIQVPFCGNTTYRDEYVPKKNDSTSRRKPHSQLLSTKAEPGHYKTTKQEAAELLNGFPLRPAESYKPKSELPPSLPFDGVSTNRADFPGYIPEYNRAQRKVEPIPKLKGLYDTTKRAMDEPIQSLKDKNALPRPPKSFKSTDSSDDSNLPFDGVTTYTVEYPPKEVPTSHTREKPTSEPVPENRDFATTNSEAYTIPPVRIRHDCPAAFVPTRPVSRDGHIKLSVYNIPSGDTMCSEAEEELRLANL